MTNTALDAAMDAWSGLFHGAKERAQRFIGQRPVIEEGTGQPDIAPRDAGWVELLSADTHTKYGRGHLFLWSTSAEGDYLKAELRSFVTGDQAPGDYDYLAVRPEKEMEMYPVVVTGHTPVEGDMAIVGLIWPDTELPAALREVGGE